MNQPNPSKNQAMTIGQLVSLACVWEATAPKPGNVHRSADFDNLVFEDFLKSAIAIGPIFDNARNQSVGTTVFQAIQSTRRVVSTNTNLGIVLLLAPLAAVPREVALEDGIGLVLSQLTSEDASQVYAAINLAQPGGLGKVEEMDVADRPPPDLLTAMKHAADRDRIALQYTTSFADVLKFGVPTLTAAFQATQNFREAIVRTHMEMLAAWPDSLIARKNEPEVAFRAQTIAKQIVQLPFPSSEYLDALSDFDFWLRSDGNRRNPGTTADLICASIFAAFREGMLDVSVV